jgi:hypothetical protein
MSKARRKYLRDQKSQFDAHQAKFNTKGIATTKNNDIVAEVSMVDTTQHVMCPFCLYEGKLQQFLISTNKGISQSMAKCPECGNGMYMKSLTANMTPESYAEWCYGYSRSGFWKKVPFERWKTRLAAIGWAQPFWDRYKALKGDSDVENYEAYVERTQTEAHQHDEEEEQ